MYIELSHCPSLCLHDVVSCSFTVGVLFIKEIQWLRPFTSKQYYQIHFLVWKLLFSEILFPYGRINNKLALIQIMAWCQKDGKPLSEPMMAGLLCSGIILGVGSANERWRYNVMLSPIGWAHTQNGPYKRTHLSWKCNNFYILWFVAKKNISEPYLTVWWKLCWSLCLPQVSRAWRNNYIPLCMWDVITYPCPRYELLAPNTSSLMLLYVMITVIC